MYAGAERYVPITLFKKFASRYLGHISLLLCGQPTILMYQRAAFALGLPIMDQFIVDCGRLNFVAQRASPSATGICFCQVKRGSSKQM